MQESQVVLGWIADARMLARVETQRKNVLFFAEKRFKADLTDEDKQMFATQDSADVLRDWLEAVVEVLTYADFRAVLRR